MRLRVNLELGLSPAEEMDIPLVELRVMIREEEADAVGVRGGRNMWDFAPESRGGADSRGAVWKLNAPDITEGEFDIAMPVML